MLDDIYNITASANNPAATTAPDAMTPFAGAELPGAAWPGPPVGS